MEEILASIRRIISDEVASGAREAASPGIPMRAVGDEGEAPGRLRPDAPGSAPSPTETMAFDDGVPAVEEQRAVPDLPPFVSRGGMNAARAESTRAESPRAEASRPAYSSYVPLGRAPSTDPFAARRRPAGSAALAEETAPPVRSARPEPLSTPAPRPSFARPATAPAAVRAVATAPVAPAAEIVDQDERLAAALLDLDLVEQAVQAELATMSSDAVLEAATADSDETRPMMEPQPAPDEFVAGIPEAAFVAPPAETPRQEAPMMEVSRPHETPSVPENADMQAKPAPVSRSAASELAEERRPEHRAEPRFLPSARPAEPAPVSAPASEAAPQRLVSGSTTTAVSTAFGTLARTVASNSRTVDDLVTEAIRPMLKEWLDENLPALVERLVRAEIERVSRQGQ